MAAEDDNWLNTESAKEALSFRKQSPMTSAETQLAKDESDLLYDPNVSVF